MTNYYYTSTGEGFTQARISSKLRYVYQSMDAVKICECCGQVPPMDHDHTVSQKRCKELGKTELIWDKSNISFSCRSCHMDWESYKNANFTLHNNVKKRMEYMAQHDREGFVKRLMYVPEGPLQEHLNKML